MFNARTRSRRRGRESSVKFHVITGVLACVCIALLVWGIWYITRLPSLTISTVTVNGGETISHDAIQNAVEEAFAGSYMKVVPYRFFLTYPEERVRSYVAEINRVKDIEIVRTSRTELSVSFSEYRPFALWCASPEETTECYFLDEVGYAFAPSPMLKGGTLIRHSIEGETELTKKQAFDETQSRELHAFLAMLKDELELWVTDVVHTEVGDLTLHVNGGGKIYMRNDGRYELALENLRTVLSSPQFKHIEPGNFQYIDIRFGNKIFVNETIPEIATATETPATTTPLEE